MLVQIFAIYDTKSKCFGQPFYSQTRGTAIRDFTNLVNDATTQVNKYPDDFTLFALGEYDDNTGEITSEKSSVINALEVLMEKK